MKFGYNNHIYNKGGAFLSILLVFTIIVAGIIISQQKKTVCDKTLQYSIGTIDSRFDISRNDLLKLAKDSEAIWEKGMGINLFEYDPNSQFKINLIFDKRQRDTITEKRSREIVNKNKKLYDELIKKYDSLKSLHDKQFKDYKTLVSSYENKLKKYNEEVAFWNNKGGAPKDKYDELERKQLTLKSVASSLKKETAKLNTLNQNMNSIADKINNFASRLNLDVTKYNTSYGKSKIFDQGEYTGDRINVYQFNNEKDLRIVITHEFGHALGLDHVKNPKSIMYYLMGKQDENSPALSTEDINALKTECSL